MVSKSGGSGQKIVAHAKDGSLIKGYLESFNEVSSQEGAPQPAVLDPILKVTTPIGETVDVPVIELKAVFFVKSLDGSKSYSETKFFSGHPVLEGIWARLHFHDNETIEGLIYNSVHFLVNEGFFIKPPDPQSNNTMMYVLKGSLRDFRIMGVRMTY